ncbi:MAG: tyrosine-type recombinase/integrase [Solirubrobacteraceae bacterium]
MSVQKRTWTTKDGKKKTAWRVQYDTGARDASGGPVRESKTFDRERDAKDFDADVRLRRQRGALGLLDAGTETLDAYVLNTWAPTYGVALASKTRETYSSLYDAHIAKPLGSIALRDFTPELIAHWQAERLALKAGPTAVRRALELLGGILQRAAEAQRIPSNPARLVRKAKLPRRSEVRPLAPATVEAMRAHVLAPPPRLVPASKAGQRPRAAYSTAARPDPRTAILISLMAYAGLRPGEALALQWGDVDENTLLIERAMSLGEVKDTKTGAHRSVRLLAPLAADLKTWRLRSGRPSPSALVVPAGSGGAWTRAAYDSWSKHTFHRAAEAVNRPEATPYDLRHSFASLLLHEGRSVIYVARQLGHGAQLTLSTYGHVIEELEGMPNLSAEDAIRNARAELLHHERTREVV